MRVLRPVCSRRRLDTMLLRLHLLGTIRNKATNGACPHATLSEVLMSDSHAHSPCRQHACAHAPSGRMQSSGTGFPLLPRWARFPMWNRDSLHARNSRVLSWTSITRRQAAGAYQSLPLPAHPTPPSTFPGASLAKAAIRTTRRWDSSRGIICISLHLPAPPCTSLHLQSPTSAPVAALITAPILVPRGAHHGAVWPHVLRPTPSSLGAAFARAKRPVQPPDKPSACRSLQIIIDGCCLLIVIGVPQNVSLSSSRRRATACSPPRQRGSRAHRSHTGRPDGRGS